jgi:hypothetical protein
MADFKTHISSAAAVSGICASLCLGAELINPTEMLILWAAGTIGGILPDIDADNSAAIRTLFTLFALLSAFIMTYQQTSEFAVIELWLLWITIYLLVRYLVMAVFKDFTVHRGIYHSLLAGILFWFGVTAMSHIFFDMSALLAWLVGFFIFIGYTVHLLLDEFYSVDFAHRRLKRSWGTAFKLADFRNFPASFLMSIAAGLLFLYTPPPQPFAGALLNPVTWQRLSDNLLPTGPEWFINLRSALRLITKDPPTEAPVHLSDPNNQQG